MTKKILCLTLWCLCIHSAQASWTNVLQERFALLGRSKAFEVCGDGMVLQTGFCGDWDKNGASDAEWGGEGSLGRNLLFLVRPNNVTAIINWYLYFFTSC